MVCATIVSSWWCWCLVYKVCVCERKVQFLFKVVELYIGYSDHDDCVFNIVSSPRIKVET